MKRLSLLSVACGTLFCLVQPSHAASVYADSVVTENVSFFGSGVITGAPDGGGAWLSNTFDPPTLLGSITAEFSGGLMDGAGNDITIFDCCGGSLPFADEFANVFVSGDGAIFTFLGFYGNGINSFDLNGVFADIVHFVRIVNTSTLNSPDIDAFQGNYAFDGNTTVPEPATIALMGLGLAGMTARRRKSV